MSINIRSFHNLGAGGDALGGSIYSAASHSSAGGSSGGIPSTMWSASESVGRNIFFTPSKPAMGEITTYFEPDDIYKPGSFTGSAPTVPSEVLVDGTIGNPEDIDFYSVTLMAGQTYVFSAYGSGPDALSDTFLYVIDDTGANLLDLDDDGGASRNSLLTYTADYTGTHYIGVGGYPGDGLTGSYTLDLLIAPDADDAPDTFGGNPLITVGGVDYGYINGGPESWYAGFGEVDTWAIEVEAGKIYSIEVAGGADYMSDWSDMLPGELDTVVVIYDSFGNVVTSSDDISFPTDISSRASFFAESSGTYYVDIFAYTHFLTGDFQEGGYSITTDVFDPADFDPIESLIWDSANNVPFDGSNTAYVYFGNSSENFGQAGDDGNPMVTIDWNEYEMGQVMAALEEYEKILGVNYEITTNEADATFRLLKTESAQYGAYFIPQDPAYGASQGVGVFNVLSGGWTFDQQQSLEQGGYSFAVILHEFGHAHGLSHPHDTGGGSEVLLGVSSAQGSFGLYDLNQGVYTVMSYNDAWQLHPDGPSPFTADGIDNGWSGTLSAFDIAALQQRYGVTPAYATGHDVYELKDVNEPGTYYETIYDTRGVDAIVYNGALDARIDLLAATLDYTPTGGGAISFVDGVWGGFTIANGVRIENASGGSGNDVLLGNDYHNSVLGNDGDDYIMGRGGRDTLEGDNGNDTLDGGNGRDTINGGNGDDVAYGGSGHDLISGGNNNDLLNGDGGRDTLDGDNGNDTVFGGSGHDMITGGNGKDDLFGDGGSDFIDGGNGKDLVNGGGGHDFLAGGNANDILTGGGGIDHFVFDDSDGSDTVTDFKSGTDVVALLDAGTSYTLTNNGTNSTLVYGGTSITFINAILDASDIVYDADPGGAGFF